jgi:arylsulfatase
MPETFADDYRLQPYGVRSYKKFIDMNYGRVPDDRDDLWLKRRNYLVNCMRLVDHEFGRVLDALDRLDLWKDTIVIFTSDHGEMNGAHRMTQKGAIHFDEAAIVNLTVCVPGGPRGRRTAAVGSQLDLVPTLLDFAGLDDEEMNKRYPRLQGRSLREAVLDPDADGPRGSERAPGDGALLCWDGLHALDIDWSISGALQSLADMSSEPPTEQADSRTRLLQAG